MSLFVAFFDPSAGDFVLALAQRDAEERFAGLDSVSIPVSFYDLLDLFHRV